PHRAQAGATADSPNTEENRIEGNCTRIAKISMRRVRLQNRKAPRMEPFLFCLVGARGFEPPTTCTPCRYATRLRYAPRPEIITEGSVQRGAVARLAGERVDDFAQFLAQ